MNSQLLVIPGHLGKDSGAIAPCGEQERWINLQQAISFCVAAEAAQTEKNVVLVVPNGEVIPYNIRVLNMKDRYFGLYDRINLANGLNADVLELHNNSSDDITAHGAEVLCWSDSPDSDGFVLGSEILKELKRLRLKIRGVKVRKDLLLIKKTRNTSVIVETGFLSNPEDFKKIDVDIDGFNEQVGLALWKGYINACRKQGGQDAKEGRSGVLPALD